MSLSGFVLAVVVAFQAAAGLPSMPKIGTQAPAFAFSKVVPTANPTPSALAALTPEALRGKVVVLDFFATWCVPCVAAIPHTNALIEDTRDLPVVYLAVAKSEEDVLATVLAKHQLRATAVLDRDGETYRNYWVKGLPFVAIIDPQGRVSGFQHPQMISMADIEKALKR